MSFGVSLASEEFQRRIDIALEGLSGQKAIADNILVFEAGDTDEEALEDHDRNLREVFNRCRKKGIKLNSEKMQLRQKKVSYMDHIISSEGLGADPNKLKAIIEMPPPSDMAGVQRVLGMVNYVQEFSPNLTDYATRALTPTDPIYYATRALTPTELKKAQIEKELLSIVSGVEWFGGFVYSRKIFINTDHKTLESIMKKSLLSVPNCCRECCCIYRNLT